MQAISPERSRPAQTALVSILTLAALALLGVVLAYWTWVLFAPRPEPRAPAVAAASSGVAAALGLFGNARSGGTVAAPTGIAIRLLGIVAALNDGRGYAAVQLEGKDIVAVREGDDVAPGIRLAEVATHHVILERGGVRETLALPLPLPSQAAATAPAAQAAPPTP